MAAWQDHSKSAALTGALAGRTHLATEGFYHGPHDSQPQPGATLGPAASTIAAIKAVEYAGQIL